MNPKPQTEPKNGPKTTKTFVSISGRWELVS